jgi:TonB-dependent SusC/RagA subfamily outer membrane receptor
LQGTIPGVIGVTSRGRPGFDNSELLLRGASTLNNNSPLVVIDGVPGRQGGLARLRPSDIESVSVLKDASAAIYGSRAANGVILVQTTEGRVGEPRIDVNVDRSFAQPTVVPSTTDSPTYMQMLNEVDQYHGNPPRFSQEEIEEHRNCPEDSYTCFNTDWYDAALKNFSQETTASASVTGGSDSIQYRVSLNGITENGILANSGTGYNQLGFRSNIDGTVTDYFDLSLNVHGRREKRETPAWAEGIESVWEFLQRGKPIDPVRFPNGKPGPAQEDGINPVVADEAGYDDRTTYYFQSNLSLNFDVPGVDGWSAEGTVAYDREFFNRKRWETPWTLYSFTGRDDEGDPVLSPIKTGTVPEPHLNQWDSDTRDILLRATSTYETTVGSHSGSLLLGTNGRVRKAKACGPSVASFPPISSTSSSRGERPSRTSRETAPTQVD